MKTYPPMGMKDARFVERIREVQRGLGFSGRDVDGLIGHNTLSRIERLIFDLNANGAVGAGGDASGAGSAAPVGGPVSPADPGGASAPSGVDERSAKNVATLLVQVRASFELLVMGGTRIAREMGATDYIMIGGTRTYAEQNALYAQGRTKPGRVVTNAQGGYSNHNFGIAGDFGVFRSGEYLDNDDPALASRVHKAVAAWARQYLPEIEWGGDWTSFRDEPHYQYRTGLTLAQMRARVIAGQSIL